MCGTTRSKVLSINWRFFVVYDNENVGILKAQFDGDMCDPTCVSKCLEGEPSREGNGKRK